MVQAVNPMILGLCQSCHAVRRCLTRIPRSCFKASTVWSGPQIRGTVMEAKRKTLPQKGMKTHRVGNKNNPKQNQDELPQRWKGLPSFGAFEGHCRGRNNAAMLTRSQVEEFVDENARDHVIARDRSHPGILIRLRTSTYRRRTRRLCGMCQVVTVVDDNPWLQRNRDGLRT